MKKTIKLKVNTITKKQSMDGGEGVVDVDQIEVS